MNQKTLKKIKWVTRIFALLIFLFAVPFYFGYGNPLPFINPEYTFFDNLWLSLFPFTLISLPLGWKFPKIAGYVLTISLPLALIISVFIEKGGFPTFMLIPVLVGISYLMIGYKTQ